MTKADPVAMVELVEVTRHLRATHALAVDEVRTLRNQVGSRCGGRAPAGDAIDQFDDLLEHLADTEYRVAEIIRDLLSADGSPWLDPTTDSFVVNLVRMAGGGRPSVAFLDQLASTAAEILTTRPSRELTPLGQLQLAVTDPEQFAANWLRAGEGAVDSLLSGGAAALGLAGLVIPGGDDATELVFGRRFSEELVDQLGEAGRLAIYDPDELVSSMVGWETLRDDPYYWLGGIAPDVIAEALSLGLGPAVSATSRVAGSASRFPDLDLQRSLEPEWGPTDGVVSHRNRPFEAPEGWVTDLNGEGMDVPGRGNNCIDCARASEANWRGDDAVAAPLADPKAPGASYDRLESWTGARLLPATLDDIDATLTELGPGSSAIVTVAWADDGAHAFNAVNDGGTIKWVDGQLGAATSWPPPYAYRVDVSIAIFVGPDGRPVTP